MAAPLELGGIAVREARPIHPDIVRGLVGASDFMIVALTGVVVYAAYGFDLLALDLRYISAVTLGSLLAVTTLYWFGAYETQKIFSKIPRVRAVLSGWVMASALLLFMAFGIKITNEYSRLWAGTWFLSTAGALVVSRVVLSGLVTHLAAKGRTAQRTVIVGAGAVGQRLLESLAREPDPQIRVLGVIDDMGEANGPVAGHRVLGGTDDLVRMVRQNRVDQVLVALPWSNEPRLKVLLDKLSQLPVHVRLAPDLIGYAFPNRTVSLLSGLPMLHLFDRPISGWASFLKAAEDRVLAGLAVAFLSPILLLIAIAVKLDSPGPVLFRQDRRGFNNTVFRVYKFRTMYHHMADVSGARQTSRNDPRVTRVGQFLRSTSLDELPQLFNVITGDMSLVGPRPHALASCAGGKLYEDVVAEYAARYRVKPGITGWAQVNGWRGETDTVDKISKRVEYDIAYIENWSIGLDLWILLRTALLVIHDPHAY